MSLFDRKVTPSTMSENFREPGLSERNMGLRSDTESEDRRDIGERVIPLVEEQLVVGRRTVETGKVRLHKHTEEWTETVRAPLTQVTWQVEHVPLNLVIEDAPEIRQEGDTTVYPVIEERLVVRRELVLVEEVRVTRASATVQHESAHRLKREHITEERDRGSSTQNANAPDSSVAPGAPDAPGTPAIERNTMAAAPLDSELPGSLDLRARRRS